MSRSLLARVLLTAMVLTGAILGFSLQPLLGRVLASTFGSSVDVWLTSMMFFQGALFAGYLYAHVLAPRLGRWHLLVLGVPLLFLPPLFHGDPAPDAPTLQVLLALGRYALGPFLVVATTSVVAQTWLASSDLEARVEPYPLYAASNVGSLLGLLGYPLLVERFVGLQVQSWSWSALYLLYAGLVIATFVVVRPQPRRPPEPSEPSEAPDRPARASVRDIALWMALAAIPSAFLLSVTNVIVMEVGSIPLVWVVPLAAYLATFIVTFRAGSERAARGIEAWPELALMALVLAHIPSRSWLLAILHVVLLTAIAWVCHLELYRRRPHPRQLTLFYLAVSLGGWIGGAAVSLLAPLVFDDLLEYPLSALAFALVLAIAAGLRTWRGLDRGRAWLRWTRAAAFAVLALLAALGTRLWFQDPALDRVRNFYGVMAVHDEVADDDYPWPRRELRHGSTLHGRQVLTPELRRAPTTYYGPSGCIAQTFDALPGPRRLGVVGLGAGVTAALARPGDAMRFFEIDAGSERLARQWFTFLDDSPADPLEVIIGDGRLELATRDDVYDLLLLDAFSGDSVPFHLLTVEALQTYLERLDEGGVLLLHVSNRFFELRPVAAAAARTLGIRAAYSTRTDHDDDPLTDPAMCVVLSRDGGRIDAVVADPGWAPLEGAFPEIAPWTDDHADLLGSVKLDRP